MSLVETRIVLFEKSGDCWIHESLYHVESILKQNEFQRTYVSILWMNDVRVRNILMYNGYDVLRSTGNGYYVSKKEPIEVQTSF